MVIFFCWLFSTELSITILSPALRASKEFSYCDCKLPCTDLTRDDSLRKSGVSIHGGLFEQFFDMVRHDRLAMISVVFELAFPVVAYAPLFVDHVYGRPIPLVPTVPVLTACVYQNRICDSQFLYALTYTGCYLLFREFGRRHADNLDFFFRELLLAAGVRRKVVFAVDAPKGPEMDDRDLPFTRSKCDRRIFERIQPRTARQLLNGNGRCRSVRRRRIYGFILRLYRMREEYQSTDCDSAADQYRECCIASSFNTNYSSGSSTFALSASACASWDIVTRS